jgi:glutamine amidotransferase
MDAVIINYGVGNLFSVKSALERIGLKVHISDIPNEADIIVFPGVGAFRTVSDYILRNYDKLNEIKNKGSKFLGICLGMQIMFEEGTEGGRARGLGWFKGIVDKLPNNLKLPHIGWDKVYSRKYDEIIEGLEGRYVYFVHSYVAYPISKEVVLMESEYGIKFPAVIKNEYAIGTQFHPEKSGSNGRIFLENLKRWLKR